MSQPLKITEDAALQAQLICPKCNHDLAAITTGHELITLLCRSSSCGWRGASLWLDPVPVAPIRRRGEPEPGDEPEGGRIGERVEALASELGELRDIFGDWQKRVVDRLEAMAAKLEPSAPEPVDTDGALAKARPWCECTWIARDSVTSWLVDNGQQRSAPEQWIQDEAAAALEAVPDLVRALNEQPPPAATQSPPRSVLEAYRALHRVAEAIREGPAGACFYDELRTLKELGVSPDKPSVPICDDSSLDVQPAHCERCGGEPWFEPTCHELLLLWQRLSGPEAYDVRDPGALANVALTAQQTVRQMAREAEARSDELMQIEDRIRGLTDAPAGVHYRDALEAAHVRLDELAGLRQELAELVETSPDDESLLDQVGRRVRVVQHLIETLEPGQLRGVAASLHKFCVEGHSPGWLVADALDIVATISDEEQH